MTVVEECDEFLARVGWATPDFEVINPFQVLRELRAYVEELETEGHQDEEAIGTLKAQLVERDEEIAALKAKLTKTTIIVDNIRRAIDEAR